MIYFDFSHLYFYALITFSYSAFTILHKYQKIMITSIGGKDMSRKTSHLSRELKKEREKNRSKREIIEYVIFEKFMDI